MKSKLHILFSVLFLALPITGCAALDGFTSLITGEKDKTSDHAVSEDKDDIECEHTWIAGNVHAPSCLEDGYTEYTCAKCSEVKHDNIVNALGHDYGEWTELISPTCLTAGEEQRVCLHDSTHVETRQVAALGHLYVNGVCERCGSEEENIESEIDKYYKDYNLGLNGIDLQKELQKMCFDKHVNYVTFGQVNSFFYKTSTRNSTEAIEDGSNINQWFYTGKEASGYGTREHVWAYSNSSGLFGYYDNDDVHSLNKNTYIGVGSDLYHVRTIGPNVNTARGSARFVDFDDSEFDDIRTEVIEYGENNGKYTLKLQDYTTSGSGNPEYAKLCEPADEMKGDVARILLYVYVHYKEIGNTPEGSKTSGGIEYSYENMCGNLLLTSILGYNDVSKCEELLSSWNELDPPNEVEKLRNETVQKIQGNRNPFVDCPELVNKMFNLE